MTDRTDTMWCVIVKFFNNMYIYILYSRNSLFNDWLKVTIYVYIYCFLTYIEFRLCLKFNLFANKLVLLYNVVRPSDFVFRFYFSRQANFLVNVFRRQTCSGSLRNNNLGRTSFTGHLSRYCLPSPPRGNW